MSFQSIIDNSSVLNAHEIGVGIYTSKARNIIPSFSVTPAGSNSIRYDKIALKDASGEYIFDRDISWEFCTNMNLIKKNSNGKVAKLCNVKLKPRQKRAGFGFDLHAQQYNILKLKEFDQIQLTAKWDGVIAWPSMYFKFNENNDEDELIEHISVYMADVLLYNDDKIKKLTNSSYIDIKSLNKILKPSTKIWFTDWCQQKERSLRYDMYKDIV